jgi:hypothetical protein
VVLGQVAVHRAAVAQVDHGLFEQRHADAPDDAAHQLAVAGLRVHQLADAVHADHARHPDLAQVLVHITSTNTAPKECIEYFFLLVAGLGLRPSLRRGRRGARRWPPSLRAGRVGQQIQLAVPMRHPTSSAVAPNSGERSSASADADQFQAQRLARRLHRRRHAGHRGRAARHRRFRHRESPSSKRTRSTGTPSASAATCVITV